jgi:hypothetical protein
MDDIIKVRRIIKSSSLRIDKLKKYIGEEAEVTIHFRSKKYIATMPAAGILKKYARQGQLRREENAWISAAKDKHDNR